MRKTRFDTMYIITAYNAFAWTEVTSTDRREGRDAARGTRHGEVRSLGEEELQGVEVPGDGRVDARRLASPRNPFFQRCILRCFWHQDSVTHCFSRLPYGQHGVAGGGSRPRGPRR